jgi:hypothetical protein
MEWISGYPSCLFSISKAAVAQWIEYRPPKPRVVGSIPASRATKQQNVREIWLSLLSAHPIRLIVAWFSRACRLQHNWHQPPRGIEAKAHELSFKEYV